MLHELRAFVSKTRGLARLWRICWRFASDMSDARVARLLHEHKVFRASISPQRYQKEVRAPDCQQPDLAKGRLNPAKGKALSSK